MTEVYPFERGAEAFPFVRRCFHPGASSCGAYRQSWRLEDGGEVVIERNDLTFAGNVPGPCLVYYYPPDRPRLHPPQPTKRMKEKGHG